MLSAAMSTPTNRARVHPLASTARNPAPALPPRRMSAGSANPAARPGHQRQHLWNVMGGGIVDTVSQQLSGEKLRLFVPGEGTGRPRQVSMTFIRRLRSPRAPETPKITILGAEISPQKPLVHTSPGHRSVRYRTFPHSTTPEMCLSEPGAEVMHLCGVGCGGARHRNRTLKVLVSLEVTLLFSRVCKEVTRTLGKRAFGAKKDMPILTPQ